MRGRIPAWLFSLAAPTFFHLTQGRKMETRTRPVFMSPDPESDEKRRKRSDKPIWSNFEEFQEFLANAVSFSMITNVDFRCDIRRSDHHHTVLVVEFTHKFSGKREYASFDADEEFQWWKKFYAINEVEERCILALSRLRRAVFGEDVDDP